MEKKEIVKVKFVKAETTHLYINGQLLGDIEWERRIDRTKNPFVEIKGE